MQAGRLNRRCILQAPRTTSKTGCAFTSTVQARRTCISAPDHAGKECIVTYTAGTDIDKHPGVRAWMLLVCGWLYAQRELLGGDNSEPPPHIAESLLASINVSAGF